MGFLLFVPNQHELSVYYKKEDFQLNILISNYILKQITPIYKPRNFNTVYLITINLAFNLNILCIVQQNIRNFKPKTTTKISSPLHFSRLQPPCPHNRRRSTRRSRRIRWICKPQWWTRRPGCTLCCRSNCRLYRRCEPLCCVLRTPTRFLW